MFILKINDFFNLKNWIFFNPLKSIKNSKFRLKFEHFPPNFLFRIRKFRFRKKKKTQSNSQFRP